MVIIYLLETHVDIGVHGSKRDWCVVDHEWNKLFLLSIARWGVFFFCVFKHVLTLDYVLWSPIFLQDSLEKM